eukprot:1184799-Prorocentrum_minimum.AAC.3
MACQGIRPLLTNNVGIYDKENVICQLRRSLQSSKTTSRSARRGYRVKASHVGALRAAFPDNRKLLNGSPRASKFVRNTSPQSTTDALVTQQEKVASKVEDGEADSATPPKKKLQQPMDFTTITAVVEEIVRDWLPAKIEQVIQVDVHTLVLGLRTVNRSGWLYISWHPTAARICMGAPPDRKPDAAVFSYGNYSPELHLLVSTCGTDSMSDSSQAILYSVT